MKKGVTNQLTYFILLAIAILILFLFFAKLEVVVKETFRDKGCFSSITAKTLTTVEYAGFAFENTMNVNCPIIEIIFRDKKAEIKKSSKNFKDISYKALPDKELNSEKVNEVITDELVACWQKFGSGTLDAFYVPRTEGGKLFSFLRADLTGCRTCAIITFESEDELTKEYTGFKEYLETTKMTSKSKRQDSPGDYFYDYIAEKDRHCDEGEYSAEKNCWESFALKNGINTNLSFVSSESYTITFVRHNTDRNEGTLNAYVMSSDTRKRVCQKSLPFK